MQRVPRDVFWCEDDAYIALFGAIVERAKRDAKRGDIGAWAWLLVDMPNLAQLAGCDSEDITAAIFIQMTEV